METLAGLEVGVSRGLSAGENEAGILHLVAPFDGGVLIVAGQGMGQGREGAKGARISRSVLSRRPQESVQVLMSHCHEKLRQTHGAVMSMASFNMVLGAMTWVGVGNVGGWLLCHENSWKTLVPSAGTLGHRMATLYPAVHPVGAGDTLIMATDGVHEEFYEDLNLDQPPQKISDHILACVAGHGDEALVVVARYRGRKS